MARFRLSNTADDGSSIFAATVTFALSRAGSDAAGCSGAFSVAALAPLARVAGAGDGSVFAAVLADAPDFVLGFAPGFALAVACLNCAGLAFGGLAAGSVGTASRDRNTSWRGMGQLQPSRIAHKVPMRSSRIQSVGAELRPPAGADRPVM